MFKLFVGLGNPGRKYKNTRHNIGFDVIDRIAEIHNVKINSVGFQGLYYKGTILDEPLILLKPQTYMNLSGTSVSSVASMYKIPPENIMIIYDDMDLPLGRIRIRIKGSAGGHNGMKSIISSLGNNTNIPRMRIGIGKTEHNTINYVLSKFSKEEKEKLADVINKATYAIEDIIKTKDIIRAMNEYNSDTSI